MSVEANPDLFSSAETTASPLSRLYHWYFRVDTDDVITRKRGIGMLWMMLLFSFINILASFAFMHAPDILIGAIPYQIAVGVINVAVCLLITSFVSQFDPGSFAVGTVVALVGAMTTIISALNARSMQDAFEEVTHLYEVRREEKNTEIARELELRQTAERANLAKSQFLANMSHELRTPLNAIIGYAELIIEDVGEEEENAVIVEDLERIHSAGDHLLGLINDILDLSKIEAGRASVYAEEFDLGELVEEITTLVDPLISNGGNKLEVDMRRNTFLRTDRVKLKQILFNLLSNAAKFTKEGTIVITSVLDEERGRLVIDVSDTGIGITEEQQGRIFKAFAQADESTTREYGGTGLGLTLCLKLAELLGGTLSVTSAAGEGSTFSLCIPQEIETT